MAKYRQEYIFGLRAVIEAIQQEKEIDKVMLKQGIKGELFQTLFALMRERGIPFQYVPEDVFKPFADRNHHHPVRNQRERIYRRRQRVPAAVLYHDPAAQKDHALRFDAGIPQYL